jgi:hypothetical protein
MYRVPKFSHLSLHKYLMEFLLFFSILPLDTFYTINYLLSHSSYFLHPRISKYSLSFFCLLSINLFLDFYLYSCLFSYPSRRNMVFKNSTFPLYFIPFNFYSCKRPFHKHETKVSLWSRRKISGQAISMMAGDRTDR